MILFMFFFFSSRRRHTRYIGDWSSDVCSSDLASNGSANDELGSRSNPEAGIPCATIIANRLKRIRLQHAPASHPNLIRSEERRVGKECRYRWSQEHSEKRE